MKNMTWTNKSFARRFSHSGQILRAAAISLLMILLATSAQAGSREQAKRIHDRLAGVPPSDTVANPVLNDMQSEIDGTSTNHPACIAGGVTGAACAAYIAMDNNNFYKVTLKNFAAPWTNRDQSVFVPLNDYILTVIGTVRDNKPFNELLSADLTYIGSPSLGLTPASPSNNNHYMELEASSADYLTEIEERPQSSVQGIPGTATAGIITSRAASEAFFIAGTNRAMFRFTLLNHMCNDMEQMHDTTLAPDRIRQDVSRSPGGDSRLFLNNCIGCHTGMDPLAGAFAYYDYDEGLGRLVYDASRVQDKYFNNDANFPQGYVTVDDGWENRWRVGQNSYLGFAAGGGSGNGAKSLGVELGNSYAFASCQVKKVFKTVCLRDAEDLTDRDEVDDIINTFRTSGYRMKQVFADTAVHCMGQ